MVFLGKKPRLSIIFEIAPKYFILDYSADYEGYSISSKCFLAHGSRYNSCELNLPIPIHFSSLTPKLLIFNLAISCLTMSDLPWFMDLTFPVPMQYCSLEHQTLLSPPDTSTAKCRERSSRFGPATSFLLEL